jgi:hypothetical protein
MTHPVNLDEKNFYAVFPQRVNALIHDQQLLRVWRKFGPEVFRRSAVLEGLAEFIAASGFSGRRCVEIGTCNGLTAIVLARHFDEVVTIDIAPNDVKREIAAFLKVRNITFVDVKDNAEKAAVIGGLAFDGAVCDGDHVRDTQTDFALVSRCGNVLLHEHWEAQPTVVDLVRGLRARSWKVTASGKWALVDGGR